MLRVSENFDPLLARPFGIFSVSSGSTIELLYRIVGRGTAMLSRTGPGRELLMLGPVGNGFPTPENGGLTVMVSGGSGFPPLYFLSQRIKRRANIHIFLGAKTLDCLPPRDVVTGFRRRSSKVHIATEDGSMGIKGMVTDALASFLEDQERTDNTVIYACGPYAMLHAVSRLASAHSVKCFVSMEERMACGLGACMGCSIPMKTGGYKRACKEGPVFEAEEVLWRDSPALTMMR